MYFILTVLYLASRVSFLDQLLYLGFASMVIDRCILQTWDRITQKFTSIIGHYFHNTFLGPTISIAHSSATCAVTLLFITTENLNFGVYYYYYYGIFLIRH
jgi:hypothetical protein